MRTAGLDIGSRTVKLVVIEEGETVLTRKGLTSHDPLEAARALMEGVHYDTIVATGYGRHLLKGHLDGPVIEIKAFALGRGHLKSCRVILDIGGRDTKVISLNEGGEMSKFEMNDKCAAGTGRFSRSWRMPSAIPWRSSKAALSAGRFEKINSMCTVFAESEVISLTAKGAARSEVALGIHRAIVSRSTALLRRIAPSGEVFFAGGVALNSCVEALLAEELARPVVVTPDPQSVGALGAAIHAASARPRRESAKEGSGGYDNSERSGE